MRVNHGFFPSEHVPKTTTRRASKVGHGVKRLVHIGGRSRACVTFDAPRVGAAMVLTARSRGPDRPGRPRRDGPPHGQDQTPGAPTTQTTASSQLPAWLDPSFCFQRLSHTRPRRVNVDPTCTGPSGHSLHHAYTSCRPADQHTHPNVPRLLSPATPRFPFHSNRRNLFSTFPRFTPSVLCLDPCRWELRPNLISYRIRDIRDPKRPDHNPNIIACLVLWVRRRRWLLLRE